MGFCMENRKISEFLKIMGFCNGKYKNCFHQGPRWWMGPELGLGPEPWTKFSTLLIFHNASHPRTHTQRKY